MDDTVKTILLVENDPEAIHIIECVIRLTRPAWRIHTERDAPGALMYLERHHVDCVVSGAQLPGEDGFALLSRIQADEDLNGIPVIMVTSESDSAMKRKAWDHGAADQLAAPILPADVLARVSNALRMKAYREHIESQRDSREWEIRLHTRALAHAHHEALWHLAKAGEYRDDETGMHVVRVAHYARHIAEQLAGDGEWALELFLTSPLHDIGKIGVPDSVLLKPGKLTQSERHVIERHCEIGASILRDPPRFLTMNRQLGFELTGNASQSARALRANDSEPSAAEPPVDIENTLLEQAAVIAASHHEKYDGTGYPNGLAGADIPLEGRVVAVADVFDALTSKRPYKPAFSLERSLEIIRSERCRHFDPDVVDAFLADIGVVETVKERCREREAAA